MLFIGFILVIAVIIWAVIVFFLGDKIYKSSYKINNEMTQEIKIEDEECKEECKKDEEMKRRNE